MGGFRDFSFRRKLLLTGMLVSGVAVLLASGLIIWYDAVSYRESAVSHVRTQVAILARNCTAAIAFNNPQDAEEVLQALEAAPHVVRAAIYGRNQEYFAGYVRTGDDGGVPRAFPEVQVDQCVQQGGHLMVMRPVELDGELIGYIYVERDLGDIGERMREIVSIMLVVIGISLFVGLAVAAVMQRLITRPVTELANAARLIAEKKDYQVRAVKMSSDELGTFTDAFNAMLDQIQSRDIALQEAREGLEERVKQRTEDLTSANVQLRNEVEERQRAEEALKEAVRTAEAASLAKSEFLANMSHEIRTPMNGVLGMLGLLLDTQITPEQREFALTAEHSAQALLTIINDILDFSKIEAGKLDIEPVPFNMRGAFEEALELLVPRADSKGVELVFRYAPGTPSMVVGDPGRIRQIVLNLLSNAVKFTERGTILLEVEGHRTDGPCGHFRISVEDTGIGIPENMLDAVFDKFTQVDASTTRAHGGTGLGLAICKSLIDLMGGKIGVESKEGVGSRFWIELELPIASGGTEAKAPGASLEGLRVLIVDDNAVNRRVLDERFKSWKMRASEASLGKEGLEMMREAVRLGDPFDFAVLDYRMPHMAGDELAMKIRDDPNLTNTILILVSSSTTRKDEERCRKAGFAAFLTKPIRTSVLRETLAIAWQRYTSRESGELITRHFIIEKGKNAESAQPNTDELKMTGKADPKPTTTDQQRRFRVLVAEDTAVNQIVAKRMLEKLDCRVDVVANGQEALKMIEKFEYHLVFMDCQMPVLDGYGATRMLREKEAGRERHQIVIAMTAHAMQGDREKCMNAGMDDYIAKPVSRDALRAMLKKWAVQE